MNHISEIEIVYKTRVKTCDRVKVTTGHQAQEILRKYYEDVMEYREAMYVLYLNRANYVLGIKLISLGGASGTLCDPKLIMQGALKVNCHAYIISHNHPSGNTTPSDADMQLTKKLVTIGNLMDLPLLDHIIMTQDSYLSMAEKGII
jgi:DNA repair protein RadC